MFGAPPPTQFDIRFVLFRIPVTVSPFFWILACILGYMWSKHGSGIDAFAFIAVVLAVFLSILVHEMGHALVVRYVFGAIPVIILQGLGGITIYDRYYYYRNPGSWGQIFISFAGSLAGFMLSALCLLLVMFVFAEQSEDQEPNYLSFFLIAMFVIGVFWGILNLMPVYPLDGGQIFREICLMISPRNGMNASLVVSAAVGIMITLLSLGIGEPLIALMFGVLAYQSIQKLQTRRF